MALFRRDPKPVYGIAEPEVKAAVGYGYQQQGNQGASQIGPPYYAYADDAARARCMSVPTISRARDLIASVIGCLPLEMYTLQWNGEEMEEIPLAPRSWLQRLDPDNTNNFTFGGGGGGSSFISTANGGTLVEMLRGSNNTVAGTEKIPTGYSSLTIGSGGASNPTVRGINVNPGLPGLVVITYTA